MDELDRLLIIELQINPRQANTRLANFFGITEQTVSKRIERLVSSGELIFTALPNLKFLGFPLSAYFGLRLERPSTSSVIAMRLCQSSNLRFISACEGFADIFLRGEFSSTQDISDFITDYLGKIGGILNIDTMVELSEIKKRNFGRIEHNTEPVKKTPKTGSITIDKLDNQLIILLQKNSRASLKLLAQEIKLNESSVSRRIKKLVTSGIIELTAIPRFSQTSTKHGFVLIETELSKIINVAQSVAQHPLIANVGIYSGPVQILAGIHLSSPENFLHIVTEELEKIDGIVRLNTLIHLKQYKQTYTWLQD